MKVVMASSSAVVESVPCQLELLRRSHRLWLLRWCDEPLKRGSLTVLVHVVDCCTGELLQRPAGRSNEGMGWKWSRSAEWCA